MSGMAHKVVMIGAKAMPAMTRAVPARIAAVTGRKLRQRVHTQDQAGRAPGAGLVSGHLISSPDPARDLIAGRDRGLSRSLKTARGAQSGEIAR